MPKVELQVGDRVRVKGTKAEGVITYIGRNPKSKQLVYVLNHAVIKHKGELEKVDA